MDGIILFSKLLNGYEWDLLVCILKTNTFLVERYWDFNILGLVKRPGSVFTNHSLECFCFILHIFPLFLEVFECNTNHTV